MDGGEMLVVRTDGASRGNPGHAAAGVVIEREDGTVLAREREYLGVLTNNQAEYRALLIGLRAVQRFAPSAVVVAMDSELVVRQMLGTYRVRDAALRPLYEEAQRTVAALPLVTFVHVRREDNAAADALANQALNERKKSVHAQTPPQRAR